MTKEQLEKANQLQSLIGTLETNLNYWSKAKAFAEQVRLRVPLNSGYSLEYVNNDFIDFEHLKLVTVAKIENKLKEAKQQLADL
jgi:hypothetical protein